MVQMLAPETEQESSGKTACVSHTRKPVPSHPMPFFKKYKGLNIKSKGLTL